MTKHKMHIASIFLFPGPMQVVEVSPLAEATPVHDDAEEGDACGAEAKSGAKPKGRGGGKRQKVR